MSRRLSSHIAVLSVVRALYKVGNVVASPSAHVAVEEPEEEPGSSGFWMKLLFSCMLVLLGGVFAGYVS